jgi:hypothetical protein
MRKEQKKTFPSCEDCDLNGLFFSPCRSSLQKSTSTAWLEENYDVVAEDPRAAAKWRSTPVATNPVAKAYLLLEVLCTSSGRFHGKGDDYDGVDLLTRLELVVNKLLAASIKLPQWIVTPFKVYIGNFRA